ncbi:MAG: hypothetical protein HWE10_13585 [Gammaproteobacteria bacterium]|nr:hypothetical protein [Gammaproteobacteria bacterium]
MEKVIIHPAAKHGEIKQVFDNVWHVIGQVKMPMLFPPMKMSKGMTIIRNPQHNELTLVNAMRLSEEGLAELESLGKIANTLRIAGFHGRDDAFYKREYDCKVYALKGQVYTREMMGEFPAPENGYIQADVWLEPGQTPPIPNSRLKWFESSNKPEALLILEQDGGIVISGDSLQNTAKPDEYNNWLSKIMMKKMGFFKPYAIGAGWVEFCKPSRSDILSILTLQFEHVLPCHGELVIGNAKEKYRPAIEGEIKGCHSG